VRALRVVIDPPVLDDLAGLADVGEPMLVQAFLAVSPVETWIQALWVEFGGSENSVERCFPDERVDVIELDAMIIGSSVDRARSSGPSPMVARTVAIGARTDCEQMSTAQMDDRNHRKPDKVLPFLAVDPLDHRHGHLEPLADQLGMQHAIAIRPVFAPSRQIASQSPAGQQTAWSGAL